MQIRCFSCSTLNFFLLLGLHLKSATIDAARGNHSRALKLYEQVLCLQQKLFGREHISIAVTTACMGDVYEALGRMKDAFEAYEDSFRIKSAFQGQHSLEVARILH